MPEIDMPDADEYEMYYSLMTFRSDGKKPAYLGKAPLHQTDSGVVINSTYGNSLEPAVQGGTISFPWGDEANRVPVPATVDTEDPFSLAPMIGYFNRPYGPNSSFIEAMPETVYVYKVAHSQKKVLHELDCVTDHEDSRDEQLEDGTEITAINRYLEWDDDVVSTEVADETPELGNASHVVGFTDGQDMHDPYTHLGVSDANSAAHAIRDVVNRTPLPLWDPEVLPVLEIESFPAGHVFTNGVPAPKPGADSE